MKSAPCRCCDTKRLYPSSPARNGLDWLSSSAKARGGANVTDRTKKGEENPSATSTDEKIAAYVDYLRLNHVSIVREGVLLDAVQCAVRTIQVQGDRSEGEKFQALFYGSLIQDEVRAIRDDPTRTLILNCCWAGFDLGMLLSPDRSPKEIERIRARVRSEMGRLGGKSTRKRPWVRHATQLAIAAYAADPSASNDKPADEVLGSWKLSSVKPPGHRTLGGLISKLRGRELPQRTGSFRKRTR